MYAYTSGVTYFFEHSPSQASEIEHFEILCHPQENQLARQSAGLLFCYSLFFLMKILQKQLFGGILQKKVFLKFLKIYNKKPVPVWPATLFKKRLCYRNLNFVKLL